MAKSAFHEASAEHVKRLNRLIDKGGAARLRRLYQQAQAELEAKITRNVGRGSAPFTVLQHRSLLAQVREGQMHIARQLGDASAQATIETQKDALSTLTGSIKRLEKVHGGGAVVTLPIEEAARFHGVIDKRKTSLLKQNRESMASYGASVVKKIEGHLALSLATGESTAQAVERVAKTADVEFWRAERIVRTEQAWAYNATQRDGMVASREAMPDLYMRWTEHCDNPDSLAWPSPMDDRVGADSVGLHGQVARPGGAFEMPSSATSISIHTRYGVSEVSPDMIGETWFHPPNRPNDRATIMPWRPSWGVFGWEVVGGRKVKVTSRRAGR